MARTGPAPRLGAGTEDAVTPGWADAFMPRRDARYLSATIAAAVVAATALSLRAGDVALMPAMVGVGLFGAAIGAGDAVTRHIPNRCNAAALASSLPLLLVAHTAGYGSLVHAALGALGAFAVYLALWLIAPAGMGLGDVKLAPYLGANLGFLGLECWTGGLVLGFLVQGAVVVVALASGRLRMKSHIAHGPAMCAGAVVALLSALPAP